MTAWKTLQGEYLDFQQNLIDLMIDNQLGPKRIYIIYDTASQKLKFIV